MRVVVVVLLAALAAEAKTPPREILRIRQLEDHRIGSEEVARHLKRGPAAVRRAAALALGRMEDPGALNALVAALSDTDDEVRRLAAFALGQLGQTLGEVGLLVALQSEKHPRNRVEIWRALGRIGGDSALKAAEKASGPERPTAVVAAGLMLRRAKRPAAEVGWIVATLTDGDPEVRAAGLYAFSRTHGDIPQTVREAAAAALSSESASERDAAVRVLARGSDGVVDQLETAMWSEGLADHWRAALVRGLGKSKSPQAKALAKGVLRQALTRPILSPTYHVAREAATVVGDDEGLRKEVYGAVTAETDGSARRKAALLCALGGACPPKTAIQKLEQASAGDDGVASVVKALTGRDTPLVATAATKAAELKLKDAEVGQALSVAWAQTRDDMEAAQEVLKAAVALEAPGVDKLLVEAADSSNLALSRLARKHLEARGIRLEPRPRPMPRYESRTASMYAYDSLPTHAVVETSVGEFEIRLDTRWAPATVKNLVELAEKGYYDDLKFHRVVSDFVIQGGDPRGDGWGGAGYTIRCENSPVPYTTGTVGMALAGKDTGGSQWFVTHSAQPHLFARYTVFGQVVRGQKVVDTIAVGDKIRSIKLSRKP